MLGRLFSLLKRDGIAGLATAAVRRLELLRLRRHCRQAVQGCRGLEIGGPSRLFMPDGLLPLYDAAGAIDGCNYSAETLWAGKILEGENYRYLEGRPPGHQYICDATNLDQMTPAAYDFILGSHVLEHIANPLKALTEWLRVLRPGGWLLLIVPLKEATFDHARPITALEHLIDDFSRNTEESDLTHLPEILKLHDLSMDPPAGSLTEFEARSRINFTNRCLHQHVFDAKLAAAACVRVGMRVAATISASPSDLVLLARKPVA